MHTSINLKIPRAHRISYSTKMHFLCKDDDHYLFQAWEKAMIFVLLRELMLQQELSWELFSDIFESLQPIIMTQFTCDIIISRACRAWP